MMPLLAPLSMQRFEPLMPLHLPLPLPPKRSLPALPAGMTL